MSDSRRRNWNHPGTAGLISLLAILALGCGPDLSQPSSLNITGRWTSSDQIGPLSGLQVDITQQPDGILNGQWSGTSLPDAACPPGLGATPTGPLNGRSTVLQVQFSLLGAGDFDGQAVNAQTLTGSLESCNHPYPITFTRAGSIP